MFENLLKIALKNLDRPDGKNRHFAFLINKNQIISFGYNKHKTHPYQVRYSNKDRAPTIHAEASAIFNTRAYAEDMVTFRLNRFGEMLHGEPCSNCLRLMKNVGIRRVWYSTACGWCLERLQ